MNIPEEKQYEYLTHHLEYLNEKIIESFELFIKLTTAIVGGVFFIHWKLASNDPRRGSFVKMSNLLLWLVGSSAILLILDNLRAWRAYRKTLSEQYPDIPSYSPFWWLLSEAIMCFVIVITCILFSCNNPLSY